MTLKEYRECLEKRIDEIQCALKSSDCKGFIRLSIDMEQIGLEYSLEKLKEVDRVN